MDKLGFGNGVACIKGLLFYIELTYFFIEFNTTVTELQTVLSLVIRLKIAMRNKNL